MGSVGKALREINDLKNSGFIGSYVIGGGMAVLYYTEPFYTYDLDVIFFPSKEEDKLLILSTMYDYLKEKGFKPYKEHIVMYGVHVQFLPVSDALDEEAIRTAKDKILDGTKTKLMKPEYLIAIALKLLRDKDEMKIRMLLKQTKVNKNLLLSILNKHGLKRKFRYYEKTKE
jgi:hypothetical protein